MFLKTYVIIREAGLDNVYDKVSSCRHTCYHTNIIGLRRCCWCLISIGNYSRQRFCDAGKSMRRTDVLEHLPLDAAQITLHLSASYPANSSCWANGGLMFGQRGRR